MKKVWSSSYADKKIREFVFERDGYKCVFCGRKKGDIILDPSHFWGRYKSATRYLPENIDAVCRGDHFKVEHAKQGFYRDWKLKQLGEKRYKELEDLYYKSKMSRRESIIQLMKKLSTT